MKPFGICGEESKTSQSLKQTETTASWRKGDHCLKCAGYLELDNMLTNHKFATCFSKQHVCITEGNEDKTQLKIFFHDNEFVSPPYRAVCMEIDLPLVPEKAAN